MCENPYGNLYNCDSLNHVDISSTVTVIEEHVFDSCGNLSSMRFIDQEVWYAIRRDIVDFLPEKMDVSWPSQNPGLFAEYNKYYWYKK